MKYRLILVLLSALLFLSSCGASDSIISIAENTTERPLPDLSQPIIIVNVTSKTVHYSSTCRFVKNAKEENLRYINNEDNTLADLQAMEYSICSYCRQPHPKS